MSAALSSIAERAVMEVCDRAAQKYPRHSDRIARASEILLAGGVRQVRDRLYTVASRRGSGWYTVCGRNCTCPDATLNRNTCLHAWAVWLHGIAQERAAVLAERLAQQFSVQEQKRLEFVRHLVAAGRIGEAA